MYKNYQFGDLNSAYIMGLYEDYLSDPDSVGLDLVDFFQSQDFKNILSNLSTEKNTSFDTTNIVALAISIARLSLLIEPDMNVNIGVNASIAAAPTANDE